MFALRGVINSLGYGVQPQVAELTKIESGEFYLTRKDKLRGGRQCIYPKAMLSVSKTNVPFNYRLTVSRVYEEGDANILDEDDDDEEADEKSFLIGMELGLRFHILEGRYTISWRDVQSSPSSPSPPAAEPDDRFEFVAEARSTSKVTRNFMERTILQAVYERKYITSSTGVSDKELRALLYETESDSGDEHGGSNRVTTVRHEGDTSGITSTMANMSITSPPAAASRPVTRQNAKSSTKTAPTPDSTEHPSLVSEIGDLYLWDINAEKYNVIEEEVTAKVCDFGGSAYNYWLVITDGANKLFSHKVTIDQNAKWSLPDLSVAWINSEGAPPFETWVITFGDVVKFDKFKTTYQQCLWEVKNQQPWSKAAQVDQNYALKTWNGYAEYDMRDPSDEEDASQSQSEEEEEEEEADNEGVAPPEHDNLTNSNLVVGHNNPRAFVVRGNKIGVFSTDSDQIKYSTTMKGMKTPKGKAFVPEQVMLHDGDSSMILTNPNDPHSLYRVDLGERGEVVEEWKVHDDIAINNMAPNSKFAPTTNTQTFLGASHNALFRIDPRMSGSKFVESESKQYVTKAKFSSLATTQLGKVVVASAKGDLRLFDSVGKNAKTALPALGDPIIGVDTTADGKWVVATTKTALLVFDMTIAEGRYAGSLGFDRSFPADAKPTAKRLMLSSQHAAYMGGVSLTPARFNTGPDQVEKTIVTSSGPYVIAWDFERVKKGKLDKYEIKQYGDEVIQDRFRFGDSNEIVVALRHNVLMVDKKQLKKPTRASLASPARTRAVRG